MKPPIISVNFYDSLRRGAFQFYERVIPNAYTHTISAFGGYDSATFTLAVSRTQAEDWLESGIMRHVEVYASALDVIWEGFVDEVRVNMGPLTVTYGPLLNMANRVYMTYAPTTETVYWSAYGSTDVLTALDNADSQDKFGVFPVVLSGGALTADQAAYVQATYMEANRWPKLTQSWTDRSQAVTVTLNCKGYGYLLNYPYIPGAVPGRTATDIITDVLISTPNSTWLTYDYANVETNAIIIAPENTQIQLGLSTIQGAVAYGDTLANRWLFYVSKGRKAYYHAAPTEVEYQAYIQQGSAIFSSPSQGQIEPHRILPGRWLRFDDFLVGRNIVEVNRDPRMMFIEKVTYRAPFGLQLAGGNTDDIDQILVQYGLGGTS